MYQIYFIWSNTLHVSDGLSVHNQEFKTVHTAMLYVKQILPTCLLDVKQILLSACYQEVGRICLTYACCCMYSLELLMMDGKTVRNM